MKLSNPPQFIGLVSDGARISTLAAWLQSLYSESWHYSVFKSMSWFWGWEEKPTCHVGVLDIKTVSLKENKHQFAGSISVIVREARRRENVPAHTLSV